MCLYEIIVKFYPMYKSEADSCEISKLVVGGDSAELWSRKYAKAANTLSVTVTSAETGEILRIIEQGGVIVFDEMV